MFLRKEFSIPAALICFFAIIFQPRFWADSHFNSKDFPYACIMAFTMFAARRALLNRSAVGVVFSSMLLGLAGATKVNAGLIPVILLFWYPFAWYETRLNITVGNSLASEKNKKYFIAALITTPLIAIIMYIAAWPYLWTDPVKVFRDYLGFYLNLSVGTPSTVPWPTLVIFFVVQPPAVLLFGGIGIWIAVKGIIHNRQREPYAFLLLWFAMPVMRMLLPRMNNFDGVRHFIEYAIPLGAITGIGAAHSINWLTGQLQRRFPNSAQKAKYTVWALAAIPMLTWLGMVVKIHPNELVYTNFLYKYFPSVGNSELKTDYWGNSYLQGTKWLNENAERWAIVVVPLEGNIVRVTQRLWMRPDLRLFVPPTGTEKTVKEIIKDLPSDEAYVMYITRVGFYNEFIRKVDEDGRLAHAIVVDGAPILKIMRMNLGSIPRQ